MNKNEIVQILKRGGYIIGRSSQYTLYDSDGCRCGTIAPKQMRSLLIEHGYQIVSRLESTAKYTLRYAWSEDES